MHGYQVRQKKKIVTLCKVRTGIDRLQTRFFEIILFLADVGSEMVAMPIPNAPILAFLINPEITKSSPLTLAGEMDRKK
jgi:hypothetical protein